MLSSLSLLGFVLVQISTSRAAAVSAHAITTTSATLPNRCSTCNPTHSTQSNALSSTHATPSTTALALPNPSLINIQPRAVDSSSVSSYSGNLLITYAPITTTDSNGALTTIPASTPAGQGSVATPYPGQPTPPSSGLSLGAKAAIGTGAVVACIFLAFFLCCLCAQTRQRKSNRRQDLDGQAKDANVLTDLKPIPAETDHKYTAMVHDARQPSPADHSYMPSNPYQPPAEPFQMEISKPISRFPSQHPTRRPGNITHRPESFERG